MTPMLIRNRLGGLIYIEVKPGSDFRDSKNMFEITNLLKDHFGETLLLVQMLGCVNGWDFHPKILQIFARKGQVSSK